MPRTSEPGRSVSSRLLRVLFTFTPADRALTLADLTRRTGLPHATARRFVHELLAAGALDRTPDGRFTVGLRLWELGTLAPRSVPLRTVALPFLEDLHAAVRQHVQLVVREGHEGVVIERFSAPGAVDVTSRVGGRLPLHGSAAGKVLLAHAGRTLIEAYLAAGPTRFTAATVTDPARLRTELTAARRSGTATVRGELTDGADSVAARVVDGPGRVVAALSVVAASGSTRPRGGRGAGAGLRVRHLAPARPATGDRRARPRPPAAGRGQARLTSRYPAAENSAVSA